MFHFVIRKINRLQEVNVTYIKQMSTGKSWLVLEEKICLLMQEFCRIDFELQK